MKTIDKEDYKAKLKAIKEIVGKIKKDGKVMGEIEKIKSNKKVKKQIEQIRSHAWVKEIERS